MMSSGAAVGGPLVLYDAPTSSNALKVRFLLAELGVRYERREIPMTRPRPASYLELNPSGLIPTLVHGEFVLGESHSILRYLASWSAREDLYPTVLEERARVDEFLDWFATSVRPAFFRLEAPALGYTPEGGFFSVPPDWRAARDASASLQPLLGRLDSAVAPTSAVLDRFTVADCALAPILFRTLRTRLDLGPYPSLQSLRASLLGRESWAAAGAAV